MSRNPKCDICDSRLKENGRDGIVLFYWCEKCDSHYHPLYDELLIVEGPNNKEYREG